MRIPHHPILRATLNLCAEVGRPIVAFAAGEGSAPEKLAWIFAYLAQLGEVVPMPESLMDPMTALYGSGRLCLYLLGCPGDECRATGNPRTLSQAARYTVTDGMCGVGSGSRCAALLPRFNGLSRSPGGTTEALLSTLHDTQWAHILEQAVMWGTEHATTLATRQDPATPLRPVPQDAPGSPCLGASSPSRFVPTEEQPGTGAPRQASCFRPAEVED